MIPLSEQIILVTGSTDGIGRQTALEIARLGPRVLLHGRDEGKCRLTQEFVLKSAPGTKVATFVGDLSSQKSIVSLASQIRKMFPRLHGVIHNAGVYMNERRLTEDGLETTFAVNHMAPFLLTKLLMPALTHDQGARIVTVSSIAHFRAALDFTNLQGENSFDPYGAYSLSKLCNILFSFELSRRLTGTKITANCLHPGVITTKLLWKGFRSSGASVEEGAKTSVYLATSPDVEGQSGRYYSDCRPDRPSEVASDPEMARSLWDTSEKLIKVRS